jgi:hypothetical protein
MPKVVEFGSVESLLGDASARASMLAAVSEENVCLTRRTIEPELIQEIKSYLTAVGRHSLPNRHPILPECPNHHRVFHWDELSYVKGCFHQFSFFPWNRDIFELFKVFGPLYRLRNLLNGLEPERYLGQEPEDECIARISFQFYPCGKGAMNKHQDPVDVHQKVVPILIMTSRGHDYDKGGLFYEAANGSRIFADEVAEPGDVVWTYAQMTHGVEMIDPGAKLDWLSFRGRWSALVAVNKMATSSKIGNAVDLQAPRLQT